MQTDMPLGLAIYDLLPNFLFLLGAYWLQQRCYRSNLFAVGAGLIFLNGISKAAWKIIMAVTGNDVVWLSQIFLPLLGLGFLAVFIALLLNKKPALSPKNTGVPLAAMAAWKIPFLVIAVVASVGSYILWIRAALAHKNWLSAVGFGLSLAATLAMSGLTGSEGGLEKDLIAQTVNTFNQTCFAIGAYFLSRSACPDR